MFAQGSGTKENPILRRDKKTNKATCMDTKRDRANESKARNMNKLKHKRNPIQYSVLSSPLLTARNPALTGPSHAIFDIFFAIGKYPRNVTRFGEGAGEVVRTSTHRWQMDDVVARIKKTRIRLVAHDQIKILKQTKNESKAKFTRQNEHEFGTSRQQNCNVQRFAKELNFSQLQVLAASLPFLLLLSLPLCVLTVYSSCRCRCCLWCSKSSHAVLENVLRLSC